MTFDEMNQAVADAGNTMKRADRCVSQMAQMIAGRLRSGDVAGYTLEKLKRELRNFNIHTNRWK